MKEDTVMFYLKTELAEGVALETEITDENVFTRCPECGAKVRVDLAAFMGDEDFDLYGTGVYCDDCAKAKAGDSNPFAFVPEDARGCMTNEELDDALRDMSLPHELEKAVREVCRNGFVHAPELKENAVSGAYDDDDICTDKCLEKGDYNGVASNVFYEVIRVNHLLFPAISRVHRLERLTALNCPDIITVNEAKMARKKIGAMIAALDAADNDLRKLLENVGRGRCGDE
jgi:predicted nucleic acid-binding Zn ribbon protein